MGAYIDWKDVCDRYPGASLKVDAKEGNYYVLGAEALVDGVAAEKYAVPFTPGSSNVPFLVRDLCIDLTYYKVVGWQNEKLGPILKKDIDERMDGILEGKYQLTTSGGTLQPTAPGFPYSTAGEYHSSFGVDDPVNWNVSSNWQDDYASSRIGDGS